MTVRCAAVALVAGSLLGLGYDLSGSAGAQATSSSAPCTTADYTLTVDVTSPSAWAISVTGAVDFTADSVSASLTLPSSMPIPGLGGATVQGDLVGGTVYVAVPPALSDLVGGASWVSVALPSSLDSAVNSLLAEGAAWCANSQSITIPLARGGSRTALGTSSIDQVRVVGVRVTQTGKRVSRVLKVPHTLAPAGLGLVGNAKVPVDIWSTSQGRLVSLSVDSPSVTISLDLTNVNQPVSITAPAGAVPLPSSILGLVGVQ